MGNFTLSSLPFWPHAIFNMRPACLWHKKYPPFPPKNRFSVQTNPCILPLPRQQWCWYLDGWGAAALEQASAAAAAELFPPAGAAMSLPPARPSFALSSAPATTTQRPGAGLAAACRPGWVRGRAPPRWWARRWPGSAGGKAGSSWGRGPGRAGARSWAPSGGESWSAPAPPVRQ